MYNKYEGFKLLSRIEMIVKDIVFGKFRPKTLFNITYECGCGKQMIKAPILLNEPISLTCSTCKKTLTGKLKLTNYALKKGQGGNMDKWKKKFKKAFPLPTFTYSMGFYFADRKPFMRTQTVGLTTHVLNPIALNDLPEYVVGGWCALNNICYNDFCMVYQYKGKSIRTALEAACERVQTELFQIDSHRYSTHFSEVKDAIMGE